MAKKVTGYIKLQIPAGQANPSPPVGPALGQQGVNIMEFCKAFNAQTQALEKGLPTPVVITVYSDRSFTFIMKTPPASVLIAKALGIPKGSATPNTRDKSIFPGIGLTCRFIAGATFENLELPGPRTFAKHVGRSNSSSRQGATPKRHRVFVPLIVRPPSRVLKFTPFSL